MKTYGRLALTQKGRWAIYAEPHVLLRAKRIFAGVAKEASDRVLLSNTPDNCRDLLWFLERYPLEVSPGSRAILEERSTMQRKREDLVSDLLAGVLPSQEFALSLPPREYQRIAASLGLASGGLLVGDELGLGKTVTGICFLSDPRTRPALIVTPTHLQRQWKDQLERFAPGLTVHTLRQSTPYDYRAQRQKRGARLPVVTPHPDVLISTYAKIAGWAETLAPVLKSVLFEEVHELRAGPLRGKDGEQGAAKCTAAEFIATRVDYRLGLSGTPIFNYGGEIFWVLNALRPGALGSFEEFREEWCDGPGDKPSLKEPEAFGAYARSAGLMIRRTRKEVGREIPELTKVPHHVESDPEALDAVKSSATELAKIILARTERALTKGEQFQAGGQLDWMLRQATGIGKAPYVARFVEMLLEEESKVVLFGWHRSVFDIWLEKLAAFKPVLYTGTETEAAKERSKKAFCEGDSRVLIISLRSGAGLDGLQYSGCRTVVFGELDWAYAVHEQGTARVHRDGQPEPVVAYYLLADEGSDPVIADVLGVKRAQLEGLRDPDGVTNIERLDTGGAHVKRLAEELLRRTAA